MTEETLINSLKKIDFLNGAPDHVLQDLGKKLVKISFDKGSHILRKGRTGSAFYILTSGSVSVMAEDEQGQEIKVTRLSAPNHFGEIAYLEDSTRIASVIAEEAVTAYLFKKEDFDALEESQPRITELLKKIAAVRKLETEKKIIKRRKEKNRPTAQQSERQPQRSESLWEKGINNSENIFEAVKTKFLHNSESTKEDQDRKNTAEAVKSQHLPQQDELVKEPDSIKDGKILQTARAAHAEKERTGRLSRRSLCLFTLQFATMFNSGLSYVAALESLTHTSDENLNRVSEKLARQLKSGFTLWQAMASIPQAFSPFYVSVVRLNEKIGNLPEGMLNLAQYLDNEEKKRSKLTASLAYPAMILLSSIVMVAFLIFYVFPRFMPLFENEGAEIPQITQVILTFSKNPTIYCLLSAAIIAFIGFIIFFSYRTPVGKAKIQDVMLCVPILGRLITSLAVSRVSRSISVLIRGSGSLFFTLKTLRATPTGVVRVDKAIEELGEMIIHQGCSLEDGLSNFSVFPQAMVSMVAAGVYSGNLPECLNKYAEMLEVQNETTVSDLLTIVEPLMLLMLGFVVGFIVLAAFLPVFQLLRTI